jgi:hypothetical protein
MTRKQRPQRAIMTGTTLEKTGVDAEGAPSHARNALFVVLWLFIILVSVVDGYLVLEHRSHLVELNPQGRLLIQLNEGKVWYLLGAKFLGTVTACAVLLVIYRNAPRAGIAIAVVIALLQFCLLMFLLFV